MYYSDRVPEVTNHRTFGSTARTVLWTGSALALATSISFVIAYNAADDAALASYRRGDWDNTSSQIQAERDYKKVAIYSGVTSISLLALGFLPYLWEGGSKNSASTHVHPWIDKDNAGLSYSNKF